MAFWRFRGCCEMCCAMCSGSHPANLTERLLPAITANREQQPASSKLKHTNTDRREKKEHSVNSSIDRGENRQAGIGNCEAVGMQAHCRRILFAWFFTLVLLLFLLSIDCILIERLSLWWDCGGWKWREEKRWRRKPNQDQDQTKPNQEWFHNSLQFGGAEEYSGKQTRSSQEEKKKAQQRKLAYEDSMHMHVRFVSANNINGGTMCWTCAFTKPPNCAKDQRRRNWFRYIVLCCFQKIV